MTLTTPIRVPYRFTYKYGDFTWYLAKHDGIDFAPPVGAPRPWRPDVYPALPGMVTRSSYSISYGNVVYVRSVIPEGVVELRYAHLHERYANFGDEARLDTRIGIVGNTGWSTGEHLHFQGSLNGQSFDPLLYLSTVPMWDTLKRIWREKFNAEGAHLYIGVLTDQGKLYIVKDGKKKEVGTTEFIHNVLSIRVTQSEMDKMPNL